MKDTGRYLYTVVCKYVTKNGIIELDLYDVFKRLQIDTVFKTSYQMNNSFLDVVRYHVYHDEVVEYSIKKVLRNIVMNKEMRQFYSYYPPTSIMYDCVYDAKDVAQMNMEKLFIRDRMSEKEFKKIYGGK